MAASDTLKDETNNTPEPLAPEVQAQIDAANQAVADAQAAAAQAIADKEAAEGRAQAAEAAVQATNTPAVAPKVAVSAPPEITDETDDKPDANLTIGEYIDRHSISGRRKRDMNFRQLAEHVEMDVDEVIAIARELGHNLPDNQ